MLVRLGSSRGLNLASPGPRWMALARLPNGLSRVSLEAVTPLSSGTAWVGELATRLLGGSWEKESGCPVPDGLSRVSLESRPSKSWGTTWLGEVDALLPGRGWENGGACLWTPMVLEEEIGAGARRLSSGEPSARTPDDGVPEGSWALPARAFPANTPATAPAAVIRISKRMRKRRIR